ncbi:MAG TPA: thioesterase family protein [Bryobacteraceae bacterium]|nr:thioesterase family protein [Bryobacteraceae bacterium]
MRNQPFIYESRVRFGDTDASGRIFYVALLNHFDVAETEFMRSIGTGYRELETPETSFPRVHVECDYTSALRFDDLMKIAVTVERVGGASFTLGFDVTVEDRHAARGKMTVVAISRKTQRPIPLPDRLRAALEVA